MKEYSTTEVADQQEHDRLMAMAEQSDIDSDNGSTEDSSTSATQVEATTETKTEPRVDGEGADQSQGKSTDNPEQSADPQTEAKARPRGEDGKFLSKEAAEAQQQDQQKDQQKQAEDSKFEKARKEEERKARSWQALEAEKTAQRPAQDRGPRFSSQQYQLAANNFTQRGNQLMEEGDLEGMREQFRLAGQAGQAARQAYQGEFQAAQGQFDQRWQQTAAYIVSQHPELSDPATPEAQAMGKVLETAPLLAHVADGFEWARRLVYAERDAARFSGVSEENKQLKSEVARLNKLTSPQSGRTTSAHSVNPKFDNMSLDEQRAHLLAQAELADA
jgi:hypothetical protein